MPPQMQRNWNASHSTVRILNFLLYFYGTRRTRQTPFSPRLITSTGRKTVYLPVQSTKFVGKQCIYYPYSEKTGTTQSRDKTDGEEKILSLKHREMKR